MARSNRDFRSLIGLEGVKTIEVHEAGEPVIQIGLQIVGGFNDDESQEIYCELLESLYNIIHELIYNHIGPEKEESEH